MGFNFNFFGTQEVRRFSYRPRFYDPETEERRKKYGDMTVKKDKPYVPGQIAKGSLRDGAYQKTRDVTRNQKVLGIITTFLLFGVIYLVIKYYPILLDSLSR